MQKAIVKVESEFSAHDCRSWKQLRKPYPTCKNCGKRLTDELSVKRGYGPECYKALPVRIVLHIEPVNAE
jgi:protein-arginine kinase activator protein McsA